MEKVIIKDSIELFLLDIFDIKNIYYISKNGDIYSTYKKSFLKHKKDKDGYHTIGLFLDNSQKRYFRISKLVLYKFKGAPDETIIDPTSEHIDGNIDNNNIDNLIWLSRPDNSSSRKHKGVGVENHEAVLTETQVIEICEMLEQGNYVSLQKIADIYGVHKSTISNIKRRKNWTHISVKYNFNTL